MTGWGEQVIRWRTPHTARKWKGCAELIISTIEHTNGEYIDIRVRRTAEHPKGEGWTGTGFRIPIDQALSLSKALEHILSERTE